MTLPTVGGDYNTHGTELNAHINVAHNADGTLKTSSQVIVQVVNVQTGAVATGTTVTKSDDTIPQKTEGDEYMTLAITPTSATNKLKIEVLWNGAHSSTDNTMSMALFQDAAVDALAAVEFNRRPIANTRTQGNLNHYMTAGTTSEIIFKVRVGCPTSGTTTFNGSSGARRLGGAMASNITITEIRV